MYRRFIYTKEVPGKFWTPVMNPLHKWGYNAGILNGSMIWQPSRWESLPDEISHSSLPDENITSNMNVSHPILGIITRWESWMCCRRCVVVVLSYNPYFLVQLSGEKKYI
jgi:hypothetical protein